VVGIVGYGSYIPWRRIKVEEIAKEWGGDASALKRGILVEEKTVPSADEDAITIAVESAKSALRRAEIDPKKIGALYIGSESKPYAVKPSGTVVAEALGIVPEVHIADLEFACKAGSEGVFIAYGLVKAGLVEYALGIGADTSQGAPGNALEYTAAAGGAAFVVGSDNLIAEIVETYSYSTDTPDFWRRDGQFYPSHAGTFTGEPAYFKHIENSARGVMEKARLTPKNITYAVFHQPNGKFPLRVGKRLGFTEEQLRPGWIVPKIGNTYSGCSLLGLTAVLDVAEEGDVILVTSFGSGAGSDSFILRITSRLKEVRDNAPKLQEMMERKTYVDYGTYAKLRGKIRLLREV